MTAAANPAIKPARPGRTLRLMTVADFVNSYFSPESAPDARTVRTWIDEGAVPGRVIGRFYYVDAAAFERSGSTGNALADRILNAETENARA